MFKKSLLSLAVISVLATGCGSSNSDPVEETLSKVKGSAVKGIVKNGLITAYALDSSGEPVGEPVGTAETDDVGKYELTLNDSYDGTSPLLIELKASQGDEVADTDKTLMVCDATDGCGTTNFGDDISLHGTDFVLKTVSPAVASAATPVTAAITPFTSMAAANVLESGEAVTDASVLAATSKISQIVGVNIASTEPVNIDGDLASGDADQQQYTIMLAALAKQAFKESGNNDGVVDIADAIANLATFNTDAEDDAIGDGGLSLTDLYDDVATEVVNAGDALSDAAQISTFTDSLEETIASNNGVLTPAPTTGENPTEVAQAKAFVGEVRDWATKLETLESPTNALLDEAGVISDTLDANSEAVLEIFAMALAAVVDELGAALDDERDVADSIELMDNDESIGTISLVDTSTDSATTITMTASDLNGVSAAGKISINSSLTAETFEAGDVTLSLTGSASNSDIALSLNDASFTISLAETLSIGEDGDGGEPSFAGIALAGKLAAESRDNGTITNEKITADVEIKLVTLDVDDTGPSLNNDQNFNLEKIALTNLTVTNDEGSTAGLSASIVINNATSFDAISYLNGDSVVEKSFDLDEFDLTSASQAFGITKFNYLEYYPYGTWYGNNYLSGPHTCAHGEAADFSYVEYSCLQGDVGLGATISPMYDNYKHVSNVSLKHFNYNGYYFYGYVELEVDDMETAESFLDATISLTGKVNLASDSEAVLSITANKTGIDAGDLTASLAYDGKSLMLTANTTSDEDDLSDASLSFRNADGTAMTIVGDEDFATGNVTVSGKEVGTIEDLNGALIMRYNDGTFESL